MQKAAVSKARVDDAKDRWVLQVASLAFRAWHLGLGVGFGSFRARRVCNHPTALQDKRRQQDMDLRCISLSLSLSVCLSLSVSL